jgi:hypothetical protein
MVVEYGLGMTMMMMMKEQNKEPYLHLVFHLAKNKSSNPPPRHQREGRELVTSMKKQ